jgi:HTH-type transcriptional regulator / antitoxin HipB
MIIRNARELGYLIRDIRKGRGFTQAELAIQAGVSRKWLIGVEAGKRTSELSLILTTLNVLGVALHARVRNEAETDGVDINEIIDAAKRGGA